MRDLSILQSFSSVHSLSRVWLFTTPWIAARQTSLSITNSRSSLRLTSIESVMPSSHLILCRPLLLLPPIPPSIRVFSTESTLHMRCPKFSQFSSVTQLCPTLCDPMRPPIPPSIKVFSNESTLRMRWPKYWSFSFSIIPSNISLPKRGEGESGMIRNLCENSTESQLQDKE